MMIWLGGFGGQFAGPDLGLGSPPWRLYRTLNDLFDPGPSRTLLFWDQREDSINWGNFYLDVSGYPDKPKALRFRDDFPASYHNRAGGLSFTDGHAEIKRWVDQRTTPPIRKDSNALLTFAPVSSANNKDITWLQERATRKIKE